MLERSPRVKAIDFHPNNPWIVFGLYSGTLALYDYSNNVRIYYIPIINRPVFVHLKHQISQSEPLDLYHLKIGLLLDQMIFKSGFLITIRCKK